MNTKELKCIILIVIIFIAACIETDIYLPAFPDMMAYFSISEEKIQSLLTWNFYGICLSGPLYGPISDSFGRKMPLIIALGLFLIGSFLTVFSQNFDHILWGRLLQGLGSGGCFTLGTAIIFDTFQSLKAIKATNQINAIIPFIMAAAPMAGGYMNNVYGFRSNFLTITFFVLISFITCLFFFRESLSKEKRVPFQTKQILNNFKKAFQSLPFWQLTSSVSFLFAGYIGFLSGTVVLFVVEFGVSKLIFPFFQAVLLAAWLIANFTYSISISKWGMQKVKVAGIALVVLGCLAFIFFALVAPQNPYLLTIGMMLYAFGANWINGFYFPQSMEILPDIKGITSSLLTSARLLITAIIVGLTSHYYNGTILPLVMMITGITLFIVPTLYFYEKRQPLVTSAVSPMSSSLH